MNTNQGQNDGTEMRELRIGDITVNVLGITEERLIAIDLRRRVASRISSGGNSNGSPNVEGIEILQQTMEDLLVNLVPDADDIDRIISELANGRVGYEELLRMLCGSDAESPGNREERRRNSRQGRRSGRSGGGGRR